MSQETVTTLGEEFDRLRRRAARQKRLASGGSLGWQRWSSTIDAGLRVATNLTRLPAQNIDQLVTVFDAVLWAIDTNESLLDMADRRLLRRFGRELRRLRDGAGKSGQPTAPYRAR